MKKTYQEGDLTVYWKPDLCIHSGKCVKGLGKVFDPNRKPWIDLTQADADAIRKQVLACPSGALSIPEEAQTEAIQPQFKVVALHNGPLQVASKGEVVDIDGKSHHGPCFLCRCGASANKPFCDGSHRKIDFSTDE